MKDDRKVLYHFYMMRDLDRIRETLMNQFIDKIYEMIDKEEQIEKDKKRADLKF